MTKGLVQDVSGKKLNFKSLLSMGKISFSTGQWRDRKIEERVNDNKTCCILAESMLSRFGVSDTVGFVSVVNKLIKQSNDNINTIFPQNNGRYNNSYWESRHRIIDFNPKIMDIKVLIASLNDTSTVMDEKSLSKVQKAFVRALEGINHAIAYAVFSVQEKDNPEFNSGWSDFISQNKRKFVLGQSDIASAWTDGETYIAFEEKLVYADPFKIIQVMVHEYCHNVVTLESHDHGVEFYESFHNVMSQASHTMNQAIVSFQRLYNKEMLKAGIKPKKLYDDNFVLAIDNMNMSSVLEFTD